MPAINQTKGSIFEWANPYEGTGELYWSPRSKLTFLGTNLFPPGYETKLFKLLSFQARIWHQADKPPFSWFVIEKPMPEAVPTHMDRIWGMVNTLYQGIAKYVGYDIEKEKDHINRPVVLYIFVAPHVAVIEHDLGQQDTLLKPEIVIIRTDDWSTVPEPGRLVSLKDYVGEMPVEHLVIGRDEHLRSFPKCSVKRTGNVVEIRHKSGDYIVRITLPPAFPGAFDVYYKAGRDERRRHQDWFYIRHTEKVKVESIEIHEFGIIPVSSCQVFSDIIPYGGASDENSGTVTEKRPIGFSVSDPASIPLEKVIIEDSLINRLPIPWSEAVGNRGNVLVNVTYENTMPGTRNKSARVLMELSIGLTPVVGDLYDLAHITSVVCTGENLWGEEVTEAELIMMIFFVALGVYGDAAKLTKLGAELIGPLKRVSNTLYAQRLLISLNPGPYSFLLKEVFESVSPALAAAMRRTLTGDETPRTILRFEEAAREFVTSKRTVALIELGQEFAENVHTELVALSKVARVEDHPAFAAAAGSVDLTKLARSKDLTDDLFSQVKKLSDEAKTSGDGSRLYDDIKALDGDLAEQLREKTREVMVEHVTSHPAVVAAHKAHIAVGGKSIDLTEYALKTNRGHIREMIKLSFGEKAFDFMRKTEKRATSGTPKKTVDELLEDQGVLEKVEALMYTAGTYKQLKKMAEGIGDILNTDHLIEQRFRILSESFMVPPEEYISLLVPASKEIAQKLHAKGIATNWYLHQAKTDRMHQLLPQNLESHMKVQDIADVYQSFWVKEQGMSYQMFKNLFEDEFVSLADSARQGVIKIEEKTAEELLLVIKKQTDLIGRQKYFEKEIRTRATKSPEPK